MFASPRSGAYRIALYAGAITVVTSALPSLAQGPWSRDQWTYFAAMACLLVLMVFTMWPREAPVLKTRRHRLSYLLVQGSLLAVAESCAGGLGITWLASMPLLGQMVAQRQADATLAERLTWTALLFSLVSAFKIHTFGFAGYLYWFGPIVGCYTFIYGFTWMALESDRRRTESDVLAQELMSANARLQIQSSRIEALTRERERTRVARELHDSLGHGLTALAVQLEVMEALPDRNGEKARQAMGRARVLAQSALQDVRDAVRKLREGPALRPLVERVEEVVQLETSAGLDVAFQVDGAPVAWSTDAEQALFRCVQEGFTNVRRHSQAKAVAVRLDFAEGQRVTLTLSDSGPAAAALSSPPSGFGLKGLRERVEALGGSFRSGPIPTGGFALQVELTR